MGKKFPEKGTPEYWEEMKKPAPKVGFDGTPEWRDVHLEDQETGHKVKPGCFSAIPMIPVILTRAIVRKALGRPVIPLA